MSAARLLIVGEQWERLIGPADDEKNLGYVLALKKFIRENKAELSSKPKV